MLQASPTGTTEPTATITSTPLPSPTPSLTPAPTEPPAARLCSPLAGYPLEELAQIVSNPFAPPKPPSDMPHHGVDLADRLPGSAVTLTGMPVLAALPGRVAGVIQERFPYGNAVIIETHLAELDANWAASLDLPQPLTAPLVNPALTCPPVQPTWEQSGERSFYLLYAHLLNPPSVQPEADLACGIEIGQVGGSGNALNPHLHFEVRVGPAGARFSSLAHYDNSATAEEMGLYCLWRVSQIFQLVNPMQMLALQP